MRSRRELFNLRVSHLGALPDRSTIRIDQFHTWPKDRIHVKCSHLSALILCVDIQTKVYILRHCTRFQVGKQASQHSDRLLPHNFEAVLAVIVILARDTVFANKSSGGIETNSNTLTREIRGQGLKFTFSGDTGS